MLPEGVISLLRGLRANRARPDMERLESIADSGRFVDEILPHAARTFAKSIHLLPRPLRRACSVAYLYGRMLDTFEDHPGEAGERDRALAAMGSRFEMRSGEPASRVPEPPQAPADDPRARTHLLLIRRFELVDREFCRLDLPVRRMIIHLISRMAEGMRATAETFERQKGVLASGGQLDLYCRRVLGEPILFASRLIRWYRTGSDVLPDGFEERAQQASVMVQLANITRDIEADLLRGIAYHPALAADVERVRRREAVAPGIEQRVGKVRAELSARALSLSGSLASAILDLAPAGIRPERAAGALLFLHTDRHFRKMAARCGCEPWGPIQRPGTLILRALPSAVSPRAARRLFLKLGKSHRAFSESAPC